MIHLIRLATGLAYIFAYSVGILILYALCYYPVLGAVAGLIVASYIMGYFYSNQCEKHE